MLSQEVKVDRFDDVLVAHLGGQARIEMLTLRHVDGFSARQIGRTLNLPRRTVDAHLAQMRARLTALDLWPDGWP